MFRLQRQNRSSKSGEKIDFKFSNFQAIQVPKGWDKLFVSVISVETGKTIAKSSKAPVRSGNCQWAETLSESVWISQDVSINALEECLFKFVVAMGSARSGILGEVIVNMASYMTSKASVPVFLPLKKCNYGTILQVKIHCLTPRTKLRDDESKDSSSPLEEQNADHYDTESKSNGSADSFSRNVGGPSSKELGSSSHPGELQSREASFSASGSHQSFDSAEDFKGREDFPTRNELNGDEYNSVGRQDSISSLYSSPCSNNPAENPSRSSHSSFNSRITHSANPLQDSVHSSPRVVAPSSSLVNSGSSKNLLQAAEDTIEELRAEAKMWERNARKLMVDLDILKNEFSNQSKKLADLDMELSLAYTERDNLKKEVGQLKLILDESMLKQTANEVSAFQSEGAIHIQKELENEIRFQQESNASLALQLNRSQESNIELVTVLQELEETIEKQKVEIENLSSLQLKFSDMENSIQEKLEENRNLSLQLQQLQESGKKLQVNLQVLEQSLEDKSSETLLEVETEYRCKLSSKENEIASLEAKLSESFGTGQSKELGCNGGSKADLIREIEALKEKLQELESDCSELTDENLELLLKLKDYENNCIPNKLLSFSESKVGELKSEIKDLQEERLSPLESCQVLPNLIEQLGLAFNHVRKPWYNIPCDVNSDFESDLVSLVKCKDTNTETWADSILHSIIGLNNLLESRIVHCEEVLKHGELEIKERNHDVAEAQKKLEDYTLKENKLSLSIQELESLNKDLEAYLTGLEKELTEKSSVIEKLEVDLFLKEEEMGLLRQCRAELEAQVSDLRKEKVQLAENMENVLRESNLTSKCLDDLRTDLKGNVSVNEILEMRFSEMESQKHELELQVLNLEKENKQLLKHISGVEAQLKYMTDERESHLLEIENSKSVALGLQDEVRRFRIETEREKLDLKQKLHDMQNQKSEAQEDCENLKLANRELQVSAESLTEECNTLQEENDRLRKQKLELHEHCTHLKTELGESQTKSCEDSERVEALEANLSAMVEAFALKEKSLTSKIDALLQENASQKEKLVQVESLLHQTCLEKTAEVENLQREIERLTEQISAARNEKERIDSEVVHEVASLHASKAKLESVLQQVQSKLKLTEIELLESRKAHELLVAEQEKKLKSLRSCQKSEEKLKTDLNDVELKLTVSEYERQQLIEETANLKVQLLKVTRLEDEISALKSELNETKLEKQKVEASLKLVFGDCEELKAERTSFLQKISISERAILEIEECKSKKVALEEKLLQMESDLSARETVNNQFCSKILLLEEEKSECLKKLQALEEHLKSIEEQKKVQSHSRSKMGDNKSDFHDESPCASGADHTSKIQMLENELSQALESNNKYKIQLQRFLSKGRNNNGATQRKPTAEGEVVAKERFERTKSSLETELRDLRERYLEMSLKYAEVEGQREDLVMQLKATKNGKKWFQGISDRST